MDLTGRPRIWTSRLLQELNQAHLDSGSSASGISFMAKIPRSCRDQPEIEGLLADMLAPPASLAG